MQTFQLCFQSIVVYTFRIVRLEGMPKLKTVKNWEKEYNIKLEWDIQVGGNAGNIRCSTCKEHDDRLHGLKNYNRAWVEGSKNATSDSVKKHVNTDMHKRAADIAMKKHLGSERYTQNVMKNTPIGKSITRMEEHSKEVLKMRFNTAYYLAKKEKPFSDYPDLLVLQEKNGIEKHSGYRTPRAAADFIDFIAEEFKSPLKEILVKARYYSILTDGSTDTSVTEQELIYVMFLNEDGRVNMKFLSIENPAVADATHLVECIKEAFHRIGIVDISSHLHGLNVDGASVNLGVHRGVAALLKKECPWLTAIHCFNHRIELAAKDAFGNSVFEEIEQMLTFLYKLYQNSSKRLKALKELGVALGEKPPKPVKASGTRWIGHRYNAIKIVLKHYGAYMTHLEELANNDSQAEKRDQIRGYLNKWEHGKYPISMAVYLDVLSILNRMSLSEQKEQHDPVKAVRRIQEFKWSMVKLHGHVREALDHDKLNEAEKSRLTYYNKFRSEVTFETDDNSYVYQGRKLKNFEASEHTVRDIYRSTITALSDAVSSRFESLPICPVFKNLVDILDCTQWPTDVTQLMSYGDSNMTELIKHLTPLLEHNSCNIAEIPAEWDILKNRLRSLIQHNSSYLNVWSGVFTSEEFRKECGNVLHIIELLLITPFSNAKLERMFSTMGRVKTDWRNRLGRDRLEANLRISQESVGNSIDDFCPDGAIESWFNAKIRRLNCSSHRYPKKRKTISSKDGVIDITELTMSDLENGDLDDDETDLPL